MITKGEKTKQFILEAGEGLFLQKGYASVSMQDICQACQLSRGGLYRHFASTKEVFMALLEKDKEAAEESLNQAVKNNLSPDEILTYFINQQKQLIANRQGRLHVAIYEFGLIEWDQRVFLNNRLDSAVKILADFMEYGQKKGAFSAYCAPVVARHIIWFLEGLKMSSAIMDMDEMVIDDQLTIVSLMITKGVPQ